MKIEIFFCKSIEIEKESGRALAIVRCHKASLLYRLKLVILKSFVITPKSLLNLIYFYM